MVRLRCVFGGSSSRGPTSFWSSGTGSPASARGHGSGGVHPPVFSGVQSAGRGGIMASLGGTRLRLWSLWAGAAW